MAASFPTTRQERDAFMRFNRAPPTKSPDTITDNDLLVPQAAVIPQTNKTCQACGSVGKFKEKWRPGEHGRGTLCDKCGVRYKRRLEKLRKGTAPASGPCDSGGSVPSKGAPAQCLHGHPVPPLALTATTSTSAEFFTQMDPALVADHGYAGMTHPTTQPTSAESHGTYSVNVQPPSRKTTEQFYNAPLLRGARGHSGLALEVPRDASGPSSSGSNSAGSPNEEASPFAAGYAPWWGHSSAHGSEYCGSPSGTSTRSSHCTPMTQLPYAASAQSLSPFSSQGDINFPSPLRTGGSSFSGSPSLADTNEYLPASPSSFSGSMEQLTLASSDPIHSGAMGGGGHSPILDGAMHPGSVVQWDVPTTDIAVGQAVRSLVDVPWLAHAQHPLDLWAPQDNSQQDFDYNDGSATHLHGLINSAASIINNSAANLAACATVDQHQWNSKPPSSTAAASNGTLPGYSAALSGSSVEATGGALKRNGRLASIKAIEKSESRRRNPANLVCNVAECGQTFTKAHNLKAHQRAHAGDKPYACSDCGRCFTRRGDCNRHQRVHTEQRARVRPAKLATTAHTMAAPMPHNPGAGGAMEQAPEGKTSARTAGYADVLHASGKECAGIRVADLAWMGGAAADTRGPALPATHRDGAHYMDG